MLAMLQTNITDFTEPSN